MIRKLLVLATGVALCTALAASGSSAAGADTVQLRVEAPSIDGAIQFVSSSGWTYRCTSAVCSVNTARGRAMTITAQSSATSTFQWWGGACAASGSQPTCTITVNDTQVLVTAHFSRLRVWIPTFGPGSINVSSAVAGGAPLVGHPCGGACIDYANGERLLFRATPSTGYRMTAWGGDCARARPDHNCALTLTRNAVVSATFERIPPKDCQVNQSCDEVGPATKFTVQVTGPGTVTAPRVSMSIPQMTCQSSGAQRSCDMLRLEDKTVSVAATGVHFLGWGGRCSRATGRTCNFVNKRYSPDPPIIVARFG